MPMLEAPLIAQALRLALAAWLAFALASGLGIDHAFWATMPVWVIAQPLRGMVFERALWRMVGTVLGGGLGLGLLALSPDPWLTALVMALLLGFGGAAMHLWQGVRSYFPMQSAITIAVVVVPAMRAPQAGMDLALDRLACTLIGALSVTLIVGLFTPRAKRGDFQTEVLAFSDRVLEAALLALHGGSIDRPGLYRQAARLEGRARQMAAGSLRGYRAMAELDAVIAASLSLLGAASSLGAPDLAAIGQGGLGQGGDDPHADLARATALLQALIQGTRPGGDLLGPLNPAPAFAGRPLARLQQGARGLCRARAVLAQGAKKADAGRDTAAEAGDSLLAQAPLLAPPRDSLRARRVAAVVGFGSLIGSAALLLTGSFAAEITVLSVVIFALILGATPLPQDFAPRMAIGVLVGVLAGLLYRLGLQPHIGSWLGLVAGLAPFMLLGALGRVHPRFSVYAVEANLCFMLASHAGGAPAPLGAVLWEAFWLLSGTLAMVACYWLLPRPGAQQIARCRARLWRDLRLLVARPPLSPARWGAIAGRRVMTLAIDLDKVGAALPDDVLALVELGHGVNDLRARHCLASGHEPGPLDRDLAALLRPPADAAALRAQIWAMDRQAAGEGAAGEGAAGVGAFAARRAGAGAALAP